MLRFEDCDGGVTFGGAYDQDTGRELEAAEIPMDAMSVRKFFQANTVAEVLNLAEKSEIGPLVQFGNGRLVLGFADWEESSDVEAWVIWYDLSDDAMIMLV